MSSAAPGSDPLTDSSRSAGDNATRDPRASLCAAVALCDTIEGN
jgi:hypothetical protein